MSTSRERVALLSADERAKRIAIGGAALALCAATWLSFAYRAARVAETECSVVRLSNGYCTVRHIENGREYTLPWDDCEKPTRWPNPRHEPADVGAKLHCWYYPSWPDDIFFEPRRHEWKKPAPFAALAVGLGLFVEGARRRRRVLALSNRPPAPRDAYREAQAPEPEPRPVLELPLSSYHWSLWILGGPFLFLGLVLIALTTWLFWNMGGEFGLGHLLFVSFEFACTLAGAHIVFHRTGLVVDANRGLVARWWGLGGRWFFRYVPLEAVTRVSTERHQGAKSVTHYLVLERGDGRPWKWSRTEAEAETEAGRIKEYLRAAGQGT